MIRKVTIGIAVALLAIGTSAAVAGPASAKASHPCSISSQ